MTKSDTASHMMQVLTAVHSVQLQYSPADLAQSEFYVWILVFKRLVHVLFQIRWLDVFNNCRLGDRKAMICNGTGADTLFNRVYVNNPDAVNYLLNACL